MSKKKILFQIYFINAVGLKVYAFGKKKVNMFKNDNKQSYNNKCHFQKVMSCKKKKKKLLKKLKFSQLILHTCIGVSLIEFGTAKYRLNNF